MGDRDGVDEATRETFATALEHGHEWDAGELAIWRRRVGLLGDRGNGQAYAHAWERSEPYERALAMVRRRRAGTVARGARYSTSSAPRRPPVWPGAGSRHLG